MTDVELLERIADTLNEWAEESVIGGYSTHQVRRHRELETEIRNHLDIHMQS